MTDNELLARGRIGDSGNLTGSESDPSFVEDANGIKTVRGGGSSRGWNGIRYQQGISGKNAGTQALSMNVATIAPGGVAYAHIHDGFEVILYILQGRLRHLYGEGLKQSIDNEAGDFIYIQSGVPHEVYNLSDTEEVVAVVSRSAADEWDRIIPYDKNRA
jgi:uncharacterized RmlC-like cupin family protein